jgi:ketosteroid isomerase-like protein
MSVNALEVVQRFWRLMASNDFGSVGAVLSQDYVLEWPQSRERVRGKANFAAMNQEYPSYGPWQFVLNRIVGNDTEVVTDVTVTDGVQHARVISFFTVEAGKIVRQVEFWPEDFDAPLNRKHLVEQQE